MDLRKLVPIPDVDVGSERDANRSDKQFESSNQEICDMSTDNSSSEDELPSTTKRFAYSLTRSAQKMLHSVHSYFLKEREQGKPLKSFMAVKERTAMATGLCSNTVRKYIKTGIVDQPGKKRPNRQHTKHCLADDFTLSLLRRTVYDFYSNGIAPTAEMLLTCMQRSTKGTQYEFPYKTSTLKEILRKTGFKFKKAKSRNILVENPRIEQRRFRYLHQIETYRLEKRNIVFIDETWFNVVDKTCKSWFDSTAASSVKSRRSGKGQCIILLHAGGENGWVSGAQFVLHTKTSGNCDYHQDIDSYNFEKWFAEQLLPALPSGSVIVMDNASYHSRKTDKIPKNSWTKANIEEWLDAHGIAHPPKEGILKQTLLDIASASGIKEKHAVEDLAKSRGCEVLRLPPYHCQFNPLEMAWGKVQCILRSDHNSTDSMESTVQLCMEAFDEVTPHDWSNFIAHVKQEEQLIQSGQMRYENEFQELLTNLQDSENSDDSSDDD